MKKILITLIALTMVATLVACGGSPAPAAGANGTTTPATPDAATATAGTVDSTSGVFFELVKKDEYTNLLMIYLTDRSVDSAIFTDGILTLEGGGTTFTIDFADTTTDRGMVIPEGYYAPILRLEDKNGSSYTSYYAKDKSEGGITIIELSFASDENYSGQNWSSYRKASLTRGGATTTLNVLEKAPMPEEALAYEVFPSQVYKDGFVARENDKTKFFPSTGDYVLYTQTNAPYQSSCLVSFDSKGNIVQMRMREIDDWETYSNLNEVLARHENSIILDNVFYYDLPLDRLTSKWGGKLAVFESVASEHLGDVNQIMKGTTYYTSKVKSSETEIGEIGNNADKHLFKIINLVTPKSEDYMLSRNMKIHTEEPMPIDIYTDELLHNGYSYYHEYLTVFGKDGAVIEEYWANVCLSDVDAGEFAKNVASGRLALDYTRRGNVFFGKSKISAAPENNKLNEADLSPDKNHDRYLSKPFLTDAQIDYALKAAANK